MSTKRQRAPRFPQTGPLANAAIFVGGIAMAYCLARWRSPAQPWPVVGTILQALGLLPIVAGLIGVQQDFREHLRSGSEMLRAELAALRNLLARLRSRDVTVRVEGVSSIASVGISALLVSGEGNVDKSRLTLEQRLAGLEALHDEAVRRMQEIESATRQQLADLATMTTEGFAIQDDGLSRLSEKVAGFAVGSLYLQWVGLLWIVAGMIAPFLQH